MCILKTVTRVAVVGGLLAGAALLVAGPQRVGAMASQIRAAVNDKIDQHIEDPIAAREQLERLAAQYPKQLATFRNELTSLRSEIADLEREREVSKRVVAMATQDLDELQSRLARAEAARDEQPYAVINIAFRSREFSLDEAYAKATQVARDVRTYEARVSHADDALAHLQEQESTIVDIIDQLEAEHAQFQAQLWQIENELELFERQEKLVKMVEKRQDAIEGYERYDAGNLDNFMDRVSTMRAEQESRLKAATRKANTSSYEDRARAMLDAERKAKDVFEQTIDTPDTSPEVDEITIDGDEEDADDDDDDEDGRQIAYLTIN
ncbi:MAG: hypothetical protein Tsb0013_12780 [Phycisphaerales bacterium]